MWCQYQIQVHTGVLTMCPPCPDLSGRSKRARPPTRARSRRCPNQTSRQGPPSWPGRPPSRACPVIVKIRQKVITLKWGVSNTEKKSAVANLELLEDVQSHDSLPHARATYEKAARKYLDTVYRIPRHKGHQGLNLCKTRQGLAYRGFRIWTFPSSSSSR